MYHKGKIIAYRSSAHVGESVHTSFSRNLEKKTSTERKIPTIATIIEQHFQLKITNTQNYVKILLWAITFK